MNHDDTELVTTVISITNSFISTLDHLPCDIARSLWLIQSLNFKIDESVAQLNNAFKAKNRSDLVRLRLFINRLRLELTEECRFLSSEISAHSKWLHEERRIMDELTELRKNNLFKNSKEGFKTWKFDFLKNVQKTVPTRPQTPLPNTPTSSTPTTPKSASITFTSTGSAATSPRKITLKIKPPRNPAVESVDKERKSVDTETEKVKKPVDTKLEKVKKSVDTKKVEKPVNVDPIEVESGIIPTGPVDKDDGETVADVQSEKYCYCQEESHGKMILCDNLDCKIEWFHYSCVGLKLNKKAPQKWFCPDCRRAKSVLEQERRSNLVPKSSSTVAQKHKISSDTEKRINLRSRTVHIAPKSGATRVLRVRK